MLIHARISKLYQYLNDPEFERVMSQISSATEEGLESYDIEVDKLDPEMRLDLLDALDALGYQTVYDNESQILEINLD